MMLTTKKADMKAMLLIFGGVFILFSLILTVFYADFSSQGKGTVAGDELYQSAQEEKGAIYSYEENVSLTQEENSWIKELLSSEDESQPTDYEDLRTQEYEDADIRLTSFINVLKGTPKFIFSDLFGFSVTNEFLLFLAAVIGIVLIYMYWNELKSIVTSLFGRGGT